MAFPFALIFVIDILPPASVIFPLAKQLFPIYALFQATYLGNVEGARDPPRVGGSGEVG